MNVRPFVVGDLPGASMLSATLRADDAGVEPFGDALPRLWSSGRARRDLWRSAEDDDGRLCGLSFALERSPQDLDVYGAVRRDLRRRGLGTGLLQPALEAARTGRAVLHAQVREPSAGRAFLERHGFALEGRTLLLERTGAPVARARPAIRELDLRESSHRQLVLALSATAYGGLAESFPLTDGDLDRFLPPHGMVLAAEHEGASAAYLAARKVGSTLAIEEVGVLPEARRHGFATALIASAVHRAQALSAVLAVDEANRTARAFYSASGFHKTAVRTRFVLR